jgi:hypothetical protein
MAAMAVQLQSAQMQWRAKQNETTQHLIIVITTSPLIRLRSSVG